MKIPQDGFLKRLSSIIKIKIDPSKLKEIHLFSDNKSSKNTYYDNRVFNINISALDSKKSSQLQQSLRDGVEKEGVLLLEERAKKVLDDFRAVDKKGEHQALLEYFKGKIPTSDLEILRAALYIKTVFERREKVWELKQQVIERHGNRGRNIINLCTAGYFISLIKPLYETMSTQSDFTLQKFLDRYDVIVTQYPFAVFVSSRMSEDELKVGVEKKMETNKKYGIRHLNIHGIGEENVFKIQKLLRELEDKFSSMPEINSGRGFINVKIWF